MEDGLIRDMKVETIGLLRARVPRVRRVAHAVRVHLVVEINSQNVIRLYKPNY